ncbi:MAG: peroxide stress protein YaaA [Crocinitomicaceae bacterium]|nr:peroxide stress protein YaaA [Crocinitomicaceae bacterium]
MKLLISPAKSIDTTIAINTPSPTISSFLKETEVLVKKLSKLSVNDLQKMMNVSSQIAALNVDRYKNWCSPTLSTKEIKPALTVFTGEVYRGIDAATFDEKDFLFANKNLRILSGLYGILKPLDLMYPYRLEMGTKWEIDVKTKNLYSYWGEKLTNHLLNELQKDEVIINLASTEYFKALQTKKIPNRIITPVFKDFKNGDYKVIMMYAKNARGKMARYVIKNQFSNPNNLKEYNEDNYRFDANLSTENEWVFTR